ncbi:MAG: Hsp20/alpha crystallin family protein [Candidatus Harrisonbacteria bacterium]|nr:Hsp20/alpha crystallin family protein [Candidatus Harrisonbacteria bacterium]MBI2405976.1 Hsp20/alpha crystallin family protein [Candidatus Harrisonbacteria bacterium]MBI2603960.1 Hsp20/alpha crystallin family protein [Candidatus Harrisonbacteria bacterium]
MTELPNNEDGVEVELAKASTLLSRQKVAEEVNSFVEEAEGQLTVDVFQTPTEIIIQSTIAGVDPEELDVAITAESVTIRGKREKSEEVKDEDYFFQECYWGRFARQIILPQEIDAENATAAMKNGVLTIRLPKLDREKTKKLKVKLD